MYRAAQRVPFPHQAMLTLALEGNFLSDEVLCYWPTFEEYKADVDSWGWVPGLSQDVMEHDKAIERRAVVPRIGGEAAVVGDLAAYKGGKSQWLGDQVAPELIVPGVLWELIGERYSTCDMEFRYIVENLFTEAGFNIPLKNDGQGGLFGERILVNPEKSMLIELSNGSELRTMSWDQAAALKGKTRDGYGYCLPGDAPVWMGDFTFRPISEVVVGDEVIGWSKRTDQDYRYGGTNRPDVRKAWRTDVLHRSEVLQVHTRVDRVIRADLESGESLYCTPDHRWLIASMANGKSAGYQYYGQAKVGRHIARVNVSDPGPCPQELIRSAAWLGGMYDGEGSREGIAQSYEKNSDLFVELQKAFEVLGFETTAAKVSGSEGTGIVRWKGGRQAALKFLAWCQPMRFARQYADRLILGSRFRYPDKIVNIEEVGEQEVFCITTTTGNFVAYESCSHNCEAYQLPGFQVFTDIKQNLRERRGKALFATTPDHPWVDILDVLGKDPKFPKYFCLSGVPRKVNPYTFDAVEMEEDRHIMTSEKHGINWEGKLGQYIGSCFQYRRGERIFTTKTHPGLWRDPDGPSTLDNLQIPIHFLKVAGGDTGTYSSAIYCAFSPPGKVSNRPTCFVIYEVPSYRYLGTETEDLQIPPADWYASLTAVCRKFDFRAHFWCDQNSQFRRDASFYGVAIGVNDQGRVARTEILREHFQHDRIFFAPWIEVATYECEMAVFPPKGTSTGEWLRIKERDHTLDGLEHVCSRRPEGRTIVNVAPGSFAEAYFKKGHGWKKEGGNPWTG